MPLHHHAMPPVEKTETRMSLKWLDTTQCLLLRIGSRQNFRIKSLSLIFQLSLRYGLLSLHSFRKTKPFCRPRASLSHKPGPLTPWYDWLSNSILSSLRLPFPCFKTQPLAVLPHPLYFLPRYFHLKYFFLLIQ